MTPDQIAQMRAEVERMGWDDASLDNWRASIAGYLPAADTAEVDNPGEHRDRRGGLHEPASPRRDARPKLKPTAPALGNAKLPPTSPAAAPSLARVVGGGLAAAVVVALRIPTNPGTRVVR